MSKRGLLLWGLPLLLAIGCSDDDGPIEPTTTATISVAGQHSVLVGQTLTLTPTTTGATDTGYTYASGVETLATVASDGTVTGVAAGETEITVTGDTSNATATHVVVVLKEGTAANPVVAITGDVFVLTGATLQLTATTTGGTDASYTWTSSTEAVATVTADGLVSGLTDGVTTLTATGADTGASASVTIVVGTETPFAAQWQASGHADYTAEAFRHWDADDPAEVEAGCATCHSTAGFLDFLGEDGSAAGSVEAAAAIGGGITCKACHNDAAMKLTSVTFPSGVTLEGLGKEALCMTCHQGRASSDGVEKAITDAAAATADTVSAELGFINVHYFPAGATLNAGKVRGGYQYAGMVYDFRFRHVAGADTCTGCHDPHSLKVKVDLCATCHTGATAATLADIRMVTSSQDYDGDGNITEGISGEISTLTETLLGALVAYAGEQTDMANICYDSHAYPYFFIDTNGDGSCQADEANYGNKYATWTPRLLRAAYNYQMAIKDPGNYAHNAKYVIELLYDSLADLNTALTAKVDMSAMHRDDEGHFDGSGEAARHWDEDEDVSSGCATCHSGAAGFRFYLTYGTNLQAAEQDSGLECSTCHDEVGGDWSKLPAVTSVTFAGGTVVDFRDTTDTTLAAVNNMCGTCHSGRESGITVDADIAARAADNKAPRFRNVHYFPAAGTMAGADGHVGYEWANKTYAGRWTHGSIARSACTYCHDPAKTAHTFDVNANLASCDNSCHGDIAAIDDITHRTKVDYDGNGTAEVLKVELDGLTTALYDAIVVAAGSNAICYDSHTYPYWFNNTSTTPGVCASADTVYANGYSHFTADVSRAAFNFQFASKEPGAWAHNFDYMAQLLYDSTEALGGNVSTFTRP
ncbi:MAG: Ig-like domain-containing protein [Deltaproteobacteria bacterium]|nr:Ig-like domain-containing protein [Deltaproteobacteria bacterium]